MKPLRLFLLPLAALLLAAPPVRAAGPRDGQVLSVAVQPAPGAAEVVINVRGAVEVHDFTLREPARLVLDLTGATLGAAPVLYDGVERGGIRNIRMGQFAPNVVRVVVDLSTLKNYELVRDGDYVRVKFGAERSFLAWSSLTPAAMAAPAGPAVSTAARSPEVTLPAPAVQQVPPDRPITVSYDNADIADVVSGFAAFSGRSIVLGAGIAGTIKVNTEIRNKPWRAAFSAILSANGLSATETPDGIIRVDSPKALAALDSLEPLETRLVRINYANASAIAKNLTGILTKGRGTVVADSATNSLIITDTRSKIGGVEDFVKGLDIRTPSVSIQAKIILVDREDIEGLGIQYDLGAAQAGEGSFFNQLVTRTDPATGAPYTSTNINYIDLGGTSVAAIGNAKASLTNPALNVILGTVIGGMSLTSFVQATQEINLTDVQAEPIITTLDNNQADILVGEETPVRVIDASSATGVGQAPRANVTFKQTGIRLTATPHVTNNRQVVLQLHTERSAVQQLASLDLGYNFAKQSADNRLLVNDGETAVIGGLTITEVTKKKSGIPLLMDLPLIGGLFGFSSSDERRRDLIILVTPRIVDDAAPGASQ
ncbi:MAG TPA: AMIN domain-containing protein [Gemmatimonadales bacterium]|nr:AMIN domain-containing protein [Gemmatimonadales bacterium]